MYVLEGPLSVAFFSLLTARKIANVSVNVNLLNWMTSFLLNTNFHMPTVDWRSSMQNCCYLRSASWRSPVESETTNNNIEQFLYEWALIYLFICTNTHNLMDDLKHIHTNDFKVFPGPASDVDVPMQTNSCKCCRFRNYVKICFVSVCWDEMRPIHIWNLKDTRSMLVSNTRNVKSFRDTELKL